MYITDQYATEEPSQKPMSMGTWLTSTQVYLENFTLSMVSSLSMNLADSWYLFLGEVSPQSYPALATVTAY